MKNRRISLKTAIACTAAALTITCGMFSFLPTTAYARSQSTEPTETVSVAQLSDIADGYDASIDGITYEIEIPMFG